MMPFLEIIVIEWQNIHVPDWHPDWILRKFSVRAECQVPYPVDIPSLLHRPGEFDKRLLTLASANRVGQTNERARILGCGGSAYDEHFVPEFAISFHYLKEPDGALVRNAHCG